MQKPSFSFIAENPAETLFRLGNEIAQRVAITLAIEASGVRLNPLAYWSAEKAMDWQPEMTAFQIPKRDLDGTQCLDRQTLLPVVACPIVEGLPQ
jgi:hypothetical protein